MAKTRTEKITSIETEIQQLENKRKQLIQAQKKEERAARTKRLCQRMGLFESLLPGTIPLTDEQFKTFLEKTVTTEHSRRILDGLTAQNAATAAPESAGAAGQDNAAPTDKQPYKAQESGIGEDEENGNGTRVSG